VEKKKRKRRQLYKRPIWASKDDGRPSVWGYFEKPVKWEDGNWYVFTDSKKNPKERSLMLLPNDLLDNYTEKDYPVELTLIIRDDN